MFSDADFVAENADEKKRIEVLVIKVKALENARIAMISYVNRMAKEASEKLKFSYAEMIAENAAEKTINEMLAINEKDLEKTRKEIMSYDIGAVEEAVKKGAGRKQTKELY